MQQNKFIKFYVDEDGELKVDIIKNDGYLIDYQTLKREVDGYLDVVSYVDFGKPNIVAYVDDEGFLKNKQPSFWLLNENGVCKYPLVGNIVVVKQEEIPGIGLDAVCLTDEEINLVCSKILTDGDNHYFLYIDTVELERRKEFQNQLKILGFEIIEINIEDNFCL